MLGKTHEILPSIFHCVAFSCWGDNSFYKVLNYTTTDLCYNFFKLHYVLFKTTCAATELQNHLLYMFYSLNCSTNTSKSRLTVINRVYDTYAYTVNKLNETTVDLCVQFPYFLSSILQTIRGDSVKIQKEKRSNRCK